MCYLILVYSFMYILNDFLYFKVNQRLQECWLSNFIFNYSFPMSADSLLHIPFFSVPLSCLILPGLCLILKSGEEENPIKWVEEFSEASSK